MHHLLEQGVAFESSRGYSVVATLLVAKLKSINSKFHHQELTRLTSQIDEQKKRF